MTKEDQIIEMLKELSAKLDEHKTILRALEHNTEIAKSERENIKADLNTTIGKVGRIEKTMNGAAKTWIG